MQASLNSCFFSKQSFCRQQNTQLANDNNTEQAECVDDAERATQLELICQHGSLHLDQSAVTWTVDTPTHPQSRHYATKKQHYN